MAEANFTEFNDALKSMNRDYSAISWNGHTLYGTKADIVEVRRLMHRDERCRWFEERWSARECKCAPSP